MKRFLNINIIIVFMLFAFTSGVITPDSRVIDYLGKEKVDFIQKNNPELIRYYNFFLDNVYYLEKLPADKFTNNNMKTIELPLKKGEVDTKKLNVLKLEVQRKFDTPTYYKLKGRNEIIVFLSEQDFMKKYNKYRKELGLIKD